MDEESKSQDLPKPPPLISPSTPRTPQELGEVVGVFGVGEGFVEATGIRCKECFE